MANLFRQVLMEVLSEENDDYKGQHKPLTGDFGSPLYDVTLNGTYPDDIYSKYGKQYYGDGESYDNLNFMILNKYHNKPEENITIYRGLPSSQNSINKGDWVTINRAYAQSHIAGEKGFKIISKVVKAKEIHCDGGSLSEWGYFPS